MGCIESNALAPRHRLLLHRMTWMSRIGGSLAEFNIAAGECFKKIKIWSGLILFVKKSNPADSFIPKNKGMAEGLYRMANWHYRSMNCLMSYRNPAGPRIMWLEYRGD
jgi:hypothetical protein